MTDQAELDAIDADNLVRIQAIISGQSGVQFQFPPSFFETLKLTIFVETLLGDRVFEARLAYANKVREICTEVEANVNRAKLMAPLQQAPSVGMQKPNPNPAKLRPIRGA